MAAGGRQAMGMGRGRFSGMGRGGGRGMGAGMGQGAGQGMGAGFAQGPAAMPQQPPQGLTGDDELKMLKQHAQALARQARRIQQRIRQLDQGVGKMAAKVDPDKCTGCGACVDACPVEAISLNDDDMAVVDEDTCTECGLCVDECPNDAISLD